MWIAFNLKGPVEKKIKELLDMDIIDEVNGCIRWVNPVVIVPKAKLSYQEPYHESTLDETLQSINGSMLV